MLGKYILLPNEGIYRGTQISIGQNAINLWKPVFTGSVLLLGERSYFLSKDRINDCTCQKSCCDSAYILYESNELLNSVLPGNPLLDDWTVSNLTGTIDDGNFMYDFRQGCLVNKNRMGTKTIARSINVLTTAQSVDIGLQVPLLRIRVSDETLIQLQLPLVDSQTVTLDISGFPEQSSPVFIYNYYEDSTKFTVLYTVNKILADDPVGALFTTEINTSFQEVSRSGSWINDLGPLPEGEGWKTDRYIFPEKGRYKVVYTLTDARVNVGRNDINMLTRINQGSTSTASFVRGTSPDPENPNTVVEIENIFNANDYIQFGYNKNGTGHVEYGNLIISVTKLL